MIYIEKYRFKNIVNLKYIIFIFIIKTLRYLQYKIL
jgi:hypothetical protein